MKSCPICKANVTYVGMNGIECLSPKSRCQNGVGSEQVTAEWHPGMLMVRKSDGVLFVTATVMPYGLTSSRTVTMVSVMGESETALMPRDSHEWERWSA